MSADTWCTLGPRLQGLVDASVKPLANCWTCKHDQPAVFGKRTCNSPLHNSEPFDAHFIGLDFDDNDMPPKDADGCPGYEPRDQA